MKLLMMRKSGPASLCLLALFGGCSSADLDSALTSDVTGAEVACSYPKEPPGLAKDVDRKRCESVALVDNGTMGQNLALDAACKEYLLWKANAGVDFAKAHRKYKSRCIHKK